MSGCVKFVNDVSAICCIGNIKNQAFKNNYFKKGNKN